MLSKEIAPGVRLWLPEDHLAEKLFETIDQNREHLRSWLPWVDATKQVEDTRAFLKSVRERFAASNGFETIIFCDGQVAGMIGFHAINWSNRRVSLGYWLAADYQGRGIVTAGCRAYLDHAFGLLKLNRVEIYCAVGNKKSRAIPERLGMKEEGIIRERELVNGKYLDHACYSMLKNEWEAQL